MRGRWAAGSLVRPVVRKHSPGGSGGRAARARAGGLQKAPRTGEESVFHTGARVPITEMQSRRLGLLGAVELAGSSQAPADSGTEM